MMKKLELRFPDVNSPLKKSDLKKRKQSAKESYSIAALGAAALDSTMFGSIVSLLSKIVGGDSLETQPTRISCAFGARGGKKTAPVGVYISIDTTAKRPTSMRTVPEQKRSTDSHSNRLWAERELTTGSFQPTPYPATFDTLSRGG